VDVGTRGEPTTVDRYYGIGEVVREREPRSVHPLAVVFVVECGAGVRSSGVGSCLADESSASPLWAAVPFSWWCVRRAHGSGATVLVAIVSPPLACGTAIVTKEQYRVSQLVREPGWITYQDGYAAGRGTSAPGALSASDVCSGFWKLGESNRKNKDAYNGDWMQGCTNAVGG
jgi:hypothetical protein